MSRRCCLREWREFMTAVGDRGDSGRDLAQGPAGRPRRFRGSYEAYRVAVPNFDMEIVNFTETQIVDGGFHVRDLKGVCGEMLAVRDGSARWHDAKFA